MVFESVFGEFEKDTVFPSQIDRLSGFVILRPKGHTENVEIRDPWLARLVEHMTGSRDWEFEAHVGCRDFT